MPFQDIDGQKNSSAIAKINLTQEKIQMAKESKQAQEFIHKRMHAFKKGHMHSHKKRTGPLVTSPKQAIAISLSEARKKGMKIGRKK